MQYFACSPYFYFSFYRNYTEKVGICAPMSEIPTAFMLLLLMAENGIWRRWMTWRQSQISLNPPSGSEPTIRTYAHEHNEHKTDFLLR
jgi:hypothetical protein